MVDGGCVRILGDHSFDVQCMLNLPDRNTSLLLLGHGTSITNEAVRLLSESCVMVGFCGTGGTPQYATSDVTFMPYQDEFRPTQYMQEWVKLWMDDDKRVECAKVLLMERAVQTVRCWEDNDYFYKKGVVIPDGILDTFNNSITTAKTNNELLLAEARWTKSLYRQAADKIVGGKFVRKRFIESDDKSRQNMINMFMNHGNYLAYGIAAVALHGMGLSFSFAVLHGKTRRGGLVLDFADLIKDPYVMPCAFEYGSGRWKKETKFRGRIVDIFTHNKIIDYMFDMVKRVLEEVS